MHNLSFEFQYFLFLVFELKAPKDIAQAKVAHKKDSVKSNYLHTPTLEAFDTLHSVFFGHTAEVCVNAFYWRAIKILLKCPVLPFFLTVFCCSQGQNEDFVIGNLNKLSFQENL